MPFNSEYHCVVVTPEGMAVDLVITSVVMPAQDGLLEVLPGHAPGICQLKPGMIRYCEAGNPTRKVLFVEGGFAHIQTEKVTIIASKIYQPGQVKMEEAQEMMTQAEALEPLSHAGIQARAHARALIEFIQST